MDKAKVRLSKEEMELASHADWILTKNSILQKTKELLGLLQTGYAEIITSYAGKLPDEILTASPKISKGENYRGLPYLVLDYPGYFTQKNVFAVRTMFWWGNFLSITLHLSGSSKKKYEKKIAAAFPVLAKNNFYSCVSDDPWQHHFENDNYRPVAELSRIDFEKSISGQSFIKLAVKLDLQQWNESSPRLEKHFKQIVKMLAG
ncbi:MAG: hypothetical protein ACT4OJ_09685 [Bacteroidota bacterium]